MHDLSTTVVAVATPPGRGGVGCLRLSGSQAHRIARSLFRPASLASPVPSNGRPRLSFGRFVDREGRFVDHGYLVTFPAGQSFTGEPTAELWPHGSPAVLAELVRGSLAGGAEAAGPGEFTYRAMCSGRLDLARAEAVRDLVEARTLYQARVAFSQAEGSLSRRLAPLREMLEEWIARAEAAVEFVDESETHLRQGEFREAIDHSRKICAELLAGFGTGRVVRDGATLAIVGSPNAGKSSLFNRLLAADRAIVSELAGTTRDTLEEDIDLDGIPLRLVDTAGLRTAADRIESLGVERAERARREADLVLWVVDGAQAAEAADAAIRKLSPDERERTVVAVNKCDLPEAAARPLPAEQSFRVSALSGEGLSELRERLREKLIGSAPVEEPIVTNARQAQALERTLAALHRTAEAGDAGFSEELLLEDLKEAMGHLGTITGEFTPDDLYERIFSTFCIGK